MSAKLIAEKIWAGWPRQRAFIGCLAFSLVLTIWLSSSDNSESNESQPAIDTMIPYGQVLVPIELANADGFDSLFGSHGLVDLYISGSGRSRPLVRGVKLLRAPLNPSQLAVLVPEARAAEIAGHSGSFTAVLSNPTNPRGPEFEKSAAKSLKLLSISYGDSP